MHCSWRESSDVSGKNFYFCRTVGLTAFDDGSGSSTGVKTTFFSAATAIRVCGEGGAGGDNRDS